MSLRRHFSVVIYLYETRNKDIDELAMDSKGWGNYSDDTFSGT